MDDRFNTIAGWTLFAGIVALGLSSVSGHIFKADKPHRPETMGYAIAGVVSSDAGAAAAIPLETLLASADPAKGEGTYRKCASCHTIAAGGPNGIGPNLHAILGEEIGEARGGYAFSAELAALGGKWDWASMDKWLTNPKAMVAGTKMSFAGIEDAQERANLLAYLNAQGSNLPLPAAPAAAAAPAEGAAGAAAGAAPTEGAAAAAGAAPAAAASAPAPK